MNNDSSAASFVSFQLNGKQRRWDVAAFTDKGRVRPINEDSYRISPEENLFVLADGLGGAAKGEVASAMAVESVVASLREKNSDGDLMGNSAAQVPFSAETNSLVQAVKLANSKIHEQGMRDPSCRGMGATIVAARISGSRLSLVHVGDSRAYLFRTERLEQLTADHSLVAEQVRRGLMTSEQAAVSEFQSVLTRALGTEESVEVDADEIELFPRDSLLLCSDGLTRMVPEDEIATILARAAAAGSAAEQLVNRANEYGGLDNVTVLVIRLNKSKKWFSKFVPWFSANLA
jgi:serine/threonine protein phosphatase PrpC